MSIGRKGNSLIEAKGVRKTCCVSLTAYFDWRLQVARILKEMPAIRKRFLCIYYGRLRRYVSVDMLSILSSLPDRPVIVDLGANDRLFVPEQVIERAAHIHAVEPDPMVYSLLRRNVGSRKNVTLYNAAIGSHSGTVNFYRAEASVASSVYPNGTEPLKVPQIGILSFLQMVGSFVDLMKIDIEGAEVPVLETLLPSPLIARVGMILVETHEHCFPELAERTDQIRRRAKRIRGTQINMNWH